MPPRYRALIHLGIKSGLRVSEATALTVDRVEGWMTPRSAVLVIDRQLDHYHPGGASLFAPLKTAASRRTVPIPEDLISILAAHLAEFGEGQSRLIFATHAGTPVPRTTLHLHLQRTAKAAGLPVGTSYHALRHTYASLLMATPGLSPVDVQHRLGHASSQMTLDVYGHLMPTSDDRTRAALENALRDYRVDADDADDLDDLDGEGV